MFIAIYEFEIKPGTESVFRKAWLEVTKEIYLNCGSLGSRLHTTETTNTFIGYAQWPDKKTWESAPQVESSNYKANRKIMKNCLVSSRTIHQLEVLSDYLQKTELNKSETQGAL
ncbi:antibiotic biosynthesis monooxygenase family protein [Vibrio sp. HN007]|uniref:antibiotic biosynthesis monooxygenase family protein n=1 Tax=Vibrio iocasae TaxID=3098914 RepID=UPI0035D4C8AE